MGDLTLLMEKSKKERKKGKLDIKQHDEAISA